MCVCVAFSGQLHDQRRITDHRATMRATPFVLLALATSSCSAFVVVPPQHGAPVGRQPRPTRAGAAPRALASAEIIENAVQLVTVAPQPLWLLMLTAPNAQVTDRVMGQTILPIFALSMAHLAIVLLAASAPGGTEPILIFADVFDPSKKALDGMVRLFEVRDFVAEEWPHVLLWDLFVGRAIWLDARARGLSTGAVFRTSLLFTNLIGPPGFLIYCALNLLSGEGLPTFGYTKLESKE